MQEASRETIILYSIFFSFVSLTCKSAHKTETTRRSVCYRRQDLKREGTKDVMGWTKPFYTCHCQAPSSWGQTGSVQHCRVSNGDHLNRKRRASRGRIALLSLLPCLPVIPVLHSPSLHQMGPSEQPPGGFLREKTEGVYFELVGWSMSASIFDSILCALCLMETWQSGKERLAG